MDNKPPHHLSTIIGKIHKVRHYMVLLGTCQFPLLLSSLHPLSSPMRIQPFHPTHLRMLQVAFKCFKCRIAFFKLDSKILCLNRLWHAVLLLIVISRPFRILCHINSSRSQQMGYKMYSLNLCHSTRQFKVDSIAIILLRIFYHDNSNSFFRLPQHIKANSPNCPNNQ